MEGALEGRRLHGPALRRIARQRGFTLLEALGVIALLALLAGAAAPLAAQILAGMDLQAGAVRLAGAAVRGRIAALRDGRAWVLEAGESGFTLTPEGETGVGEKLPGRVRLRAATSGGDVRFAPNGNAENATFTLAVDGRERRVVINQRGRVHLE